MQINQPDHYKNIKPRLGPSSVAVVGPTPNTPSTSAVDDSARRASTAASLINSIDLARQLVLLAACYLMD